MEDYRFSSTPFRIDDFDGSIIFFGYPLFGGWLPYIGFVTFINEREESMKTFMIEWFLRGIILHRTKDEDWYDGD